ncbi:hypothetical protein F511_21847 [Dorcoceras hygrometricum]|uniref:Uncharacterized protein n=1 Tax=Dorcoceras hygrometricum TaxID=472368 RepID=A0A2Z7AAE5_9LAMI|nr:hypothetical protein F511_21847 [Dorcoceras hygrometricum]
MSLFDLQDVRIAIGSIATLDLPMAVDLIGIYGLKTPYCTLTTTNWFLQALSVIPRGSWGDFARRSYHDPMGKVRNCDPGATMVVGPRLASLVCRPFSSPKAAAAAVAARLRRKTVSGQFDEENPFMLISSVLLVQADEGVSFLVVDRIGNFYRNLPRRADVIVTTVGARHKCQQCSGFEHPMNDDIYIAFSIETKTESKFRLESPPHTVAPHRAHERPRYMRAGRAWMRAASRYRREMVRRCWTMRKARWPAVFARDDGRCWKRWSTLAERPLRDEARTCAATPRDSRRLLAGRSDAGWTRCASSRPLLVEALHAAGCALPCALEAHVIFVDGGAAGRPAAPASLRRCRDGWSDFF